MAAFRNAGVFNEDGEAHVSIAYTIYCILVTLNENASLGNSVFARVQA